MKIPRQAFVAIILFFVTIGILFGWKYWSTSSLDSKILAEYDALLSQANSGSGPCDYPPLGNPETEAQRIARECGSQVCQHNLDNPQDQWHGWPCVCKAGCAAGNQDMCDAMNGTIPSFICNPCIIPPEHPAGNGKKGTAECASSSSSSSQKSCPGDSVLQSDPQKPNFNECICTSCPTGNCPFDLVNVNGMCPCGSGPIAENPSFFRRWFGWILGAQVQQGGAPCVCKDPKAKPKPNDANSCTCPDGSVINKDGTCPIECPEGTTKFADNYCSECGNATTKEASASCCNRECQDAYDNCVKTAAGNAVKARACTDGKGMCVTWCVCAARQGSGGNDKKNEANVLSNLRADVAGAGKNAGECYSNCCKEKTGKCLSCDDSERGLCYRYEIAQDCRAKCVGEICPMSDPDPGQDPEEPPPSGGSSTTSSGGGNGDISGISGDFGSNGVDLSGSDQSGNSGGNNSGSSGTGGPTDAHNPSCYPSNLSQTLNNPSIPQQCGGSCPERTFGSLVVQGTCASPSDSFDTKSNDIYTEVPVNDFGYASEFSQCSCVYLLSKTSSSSSSFEVSSSSSISSNGACAGSIGPNGVRQCGGTCPSGQLCGFWGDGSGPNVCGCKSFTRNGSSSSGSGGSGGTSASSASTTSSTSSYSSQSSAGKCGWNGQQCGGSCSSGTSCKLDSSGSSPNCVCAAPSESCGFNGSQCGGTCEGNATCRQIDAGCQCVVNPEQRCNPINNICGGSCPANQVCAQVTREVSLPQCTVETAGEECTTTHGERGICGFIAGNYLTFECTRQDTRCRPYHEVGDFCTDNDEDGTCQRLQNSTELVCVKNKQLTSEEIQNRPFDRPFCGCIPAGGSSSAGTAGNAGNAGTISGGGSTAQVAGGPAGLTGSSSGGSSGSSSARSTSSSSGGSSGASSQSSRGTSSSSSGGGSSQSSRSTSSSSSSSSGGSSQSSRSTSSSSSSGGSSQSSRSSSSTSSSRASGDSSRSSSSKSSSSSSSSSGGSTSGSIGSSRCGDAVKQSNEQCDNGIQNRDIANSCRTNCTNPRCGDKIVDSGEQCDDGNSVNTDFCTSSCTLTIVSGGTCGDGILQPSRGEQCDMGSLNSFLPNQCRPTCTLAVCGDGTRDTNEQCDDRNLIQHDGCSNFCLLERSISMSSAHPAPTTGGTGYVSGQVAGGISGSTAGQLSGQLGDETVGGISGYTAGQVSGNATAGAVSGQLGGANQTAGNPGGGYSAGSFGGYTAGTVSGGTASGNPWGGSVVRTAIPPATQTQTGPGLVILIATGAAAGIGYVRRRRMK